MRRRSWQRCPPNYAAYGAKTSRVIPWKLLNDGFDMMGLNPRSKTTEARAPNLIPGSRGAAHRIFPD